MQDDEVVLVNCEPLHHVIFDDGVLRVINAVLEPGDVTLVHTHERANVAITIEPGRLWSLDHKADAQRLDYASPLGRVSFKRGPYTHTVGNPGETRVRIMHFEILAAAAKVPAVTSATDGLEVENDAIRIYRHRLAAGTRTPGHRRSAPVVLCSVDAPLDVGGQRLRPGDFSWHADGVVPEISIDGAGGAELIEMEWL